jgi:hypothetical protein
MLPLAAASLTCSLMRQFSNSGGATRFTLTLTACLVLLLVFGALTARYILIDLPAEIAQRAGAHISDTAREIAEKVATAFEVQPQVTVDRRTIVEQKNAVLQLVTLEKTITERQRITDSWMNSTKILEVECDFVVRAGFDLTKPFVIDVDRNGSSLRVTLPPAKILGVEIRDVRFLRDEDGLVNKLTPADREAALRDLRNQIGLAVRKEGLPAQARAIAVKRLTDLLSARDRTIRFEPEWEK